MSALPVTKDSALTLDERVAVLTFKRNDVRNALSSTELTADIVATLAWANASSDVFGTDSDRRGQRILGGRQHQDHG